MSDLNELNDPTGNFNVADLEHEDDCTPFACYCGKWKAGTRALVANIVALRESGNALYDAGVWTCDRKVDAAALWTALRDAMGREPGTSPKPADRSWFEVADDGKSVTINVAQCPKPESLDRALRELGIDPNLSASDLELGYNRSAQPRPIFAPKGDS